MMIGHTLSVFTGTVSRVKESELLARTEMRDKLLSDEKICNSQYIKDQLLSPSWSELVSGIQYSHLSRYFTFEEIVRAEYVDPYLFKETVRQEIRNNPQFRIFQKIRSSFWRWGKNNDALTWNTAVAMYEDLISFSIDEKDFEVTLDWTTGFNEKGRSELQRIFLDGVFGYYIHYKGEHVMTIGFSCTDKGELLVQQIQLVKSKGNRFLYKLPMHYFNWSMLHIQRHFCNRRVYFVDGESLANSIVNSYQSGVERYREMYKSQLGFLRSISKSGDKKYILGDMKYLYTEYTFFRGKVSSFLSKDFSRIISLYSRIETSKDVCIERNDLRHHLVT